MKKILILVRYETRESFDQKSTYIKSLGLIDNKKCDYTICELEKILFRYDGASLSLLLEDGSTDVADFDAVFLTGWFKTKILEDIALSVAIYAESKGIKVINSEARHTRSRSKLSQYIYASLDRISSPQFMFCADKNLFKQAIKKYAQEYPVILKGVNANRGAENFFVTSEEQAFGIVDSPSADDISYVLQAYIPGDGDYRVITMGENVAIVIHRKSQNGSHINNTSQGGVANICSNDVLPEEVAKDLIRLAKLLGREVAGIDILQHKETGEFFLLEINNMPQLATGSYINEKLTALDSYFDNL